MELEEVGAPIESRIVFLFASSDEYIEEMHSVYKFGMLSGTYATKVVGLCLAFYKKFNTAPKEKLGQFFENAIALKKLTPEIAAEMRIVMAGFAKEPPVTDIEFEIAETYAYFQSTSLNLIAIEAQELIKEGKIDEARELMQDTDTAQSIKVLGSDVYDYSDEEIENIFKKEDERVIHLNGYLGKLLNDVLTRNAYVAFMGRGKVGKSNWMIYLARMARNQGRRVIFFGTGDLTKNQCIKRILQGDGKTTANPEYLEMQRVPYLDCVKNQKGICFEREGDGSLLNEWNEVDPYLPEGESEYKPCCKCQDSKFEQSITYKRVKRPLLTPELTKKLKLGWHASNNGGKLHIEHHPLGTLTCAEMRSTIKRVCKTYGWDNPDVVIVDQADTMAEEHKDQRAGVNIRWRFLRAFADIFNCLMITNTQSNSSAFDFDDLSLQSFSEDKRKIDNCSALIAINQTIEERAENIWRLAALLKREAMYDERHQCKCYGCLALGTPNIVSVHHFASPPKPKPYNR